MPIKLSKDIDKNKLISAVLPAQTKTYTVIPHAFVIDNIEQALNSYGFTIEKEEYRSNFDASIACGTFIVNYQNDPELKMTYSFANSYNKVTRLRAAVGTMNVNNGTYMISDSQLWRRKHTGTSDKETAQTIINHLKDARLYYDELKAAKDKMSTMTITTVEFGALVGELFFKDLLSFDQINKVYKEYFKPSFIYTTPADSLWTCYNHILVALKDSHPKAWLGNQIGVHLWVCNKFNLFNFDDEPVNDSEAIDITIPSTKVPVEETKEIEVVNESIEEKVEETTFITDCVENINEDNDNEPIYIPVSDFPNGEIGDTFSLDESDNYYTIDEQVDLDGEQFFKCSSLKVENSTETTDVKEDIETTTIEGEIVPIIPGILAGVEEIQPEPKIESEEVSTITNEVIEDNSTQLNLLDAIEEIESNSNIETTPEETIESEENYEYFSNDGLETLTTDDLFESENVIYKVISNADNIITAIRMDAHAEPKEEKLEITQESKTENPVPSEEKEIGEGINEVIEDIDTPEVAEEAIEETIEEETTNQETEEESSFMLPGFGDVVLPEPTAEIVKEESIIIEDIPTLQEIESIPVVEVELPDTTDIIEEAETEVPSSVPPMNPVVYDVIREELVAIFGEIEDFTYTETDVQYDITMSTQETLVFAKSYINSKL